MPKRMSWIKNMLISFPLAALIGCSDSSTSSIQSSITPALKKAAFESFIFPGTATDAKRTGFTDCKAEYSYYECQQSSPKPILGIIPSSIRVYLNGNNNFDVEDFSENHGDIRELPMEKLSYSSIKVSFPKDIYDEKCIYKKRKEMYEQPAECIVKKGAIALGEKLKRDGWIERSWKSYRYYIKENTPVKISIQPYQGDVEFYFESVPEINANISAMRDSEAKELKKEKQSSSIIEEMKKQ